MTPRERNLMEIDCIAKQHLLTSEDILGKSRKRMIVNARRKCMVMLRNKGHTTTEIGRILNRDHSTVVHSLQALAKQEALGG